MKITRNELVDIVKEAIEDGWFNEVTEEVLNDEIEMDHLIRAFVSELKKKRVVRGKKAKLKVVCPKGKKYVPARRQCVRVAGIEKYKKRRGAKKAAKKRKTKMSKILRKRKKSMKVRKSRGLK